MSVLSQRFLSLLREVFKLLRTLENTQYSYTRHKRNSARRDPATARGQYMRARVHELPWWASLFLVLGRIPAGDQQLDGRRALLCANQPDSFPLFSSLPCVHRVPVTQCVHGHVLLRTDRVMCANGSAPCAHCARARMVGNIYTSICRVEGEGVSTLPEHERQH